MGLHAQCQSFHATHNEEEVPGRGDRADGVFDVAQLFRQIGSIGHQRPTNHIAVPAVILGRAIRDNICPQRQRLHQVWRGKGIVDDRQCLVGFCDGTQCGDVGDAQHRIGGRLDPEQFGRAGECRSHGCLVGHVDEGRGDAVLGEDFGEQAVRAAVDIITGDDVITGREHV